MNNSLLKNGLYNAIAGVIRIGLGVLTIPGLIRVLGVEEYGLWTLASAVIGMVALAEAGLSVATTVFVSQDLGKEDVDGLSQTLTVTFGAMLILATLAALALWFGSEPIVSYFPKLRESQQLSSVQALQIGGLVVWSRLLQQVLVGVEQAYQRYDLMNVLNTIQSLLVSLGMLAVVWLGGRTVALMQWQALASLAVLLSHVWVVWLLVRGLNLRLIWNRKKGLAVVRYSLMNWLSFIGSTLFSRGDRLILGSLLGAKVLGVYAAINDIASQINVFSALPVQPLIPNLSNLSVRDNIEQSNLQHQVEQAFKINIIFALGLGATLITFSPLVLSLLFPGTGSEYRLPFCIAILIYALYSMNAVGYYALLSMDGVNTCVVVVAASGIISLIMIAIGSNSFGLVGAVLGNSGYLLTLVLVVLGMNQLSISQKAWIECLKLPLTCFIITIVTEFIFHNIIGRLGVILSFSFILIVWFINRHR